METALGLSILLFCALAGGLLSSLPGCGGEDRAPDAARDRAERPSAGIVFSGTVRHKDTGEPINEFRARLIACERAEGAEPDPSLLETDGRDGSFSFFPARGGRYKLYVKSRDFVSRYIRNIDVPAGTGLTGYVVTMVPGLHLEGRVVDDLTDQPVEGAVVSDLHALRSTPEQDRDWVFDGSRRTDSEGRFFLGGLVAKSYTVAVIHPRYGEESLVAAPDGKEILFRLKKAARITGTARDDSGAPAAGLKITFAGEYLPLERSVLTDSSGAYAIPPLKPGLITISAGEDRPAEGQPPRFTAETRKIELAQADRVVDFGPLPRHASWSGTFFDWKNTPVGGGTIILRPIVDGESLERFSVERIAKADSAGRFALKKLPPGLYEVILAFPGIRTITPITWDSLAFAESQELQKDIRIGGGVVEGRIIDGFTGEAIAVPNVRVLAACGTGAEERYMVPAGRNGSFLFVNVPPGTYLLQAAAPRRAKGMIKNVEILPGQVIDDLRIVIPVHGELRLKFEEMAALAGRTYEVRAETDDRDEAVPMGSHKVGAAKFWDFKINLKPGTWTVLVAFDGLGTIERAVEIKKLETSEIEVFGKDFRIEEKQR